MSTRPWGAVARNSGPLPARRQERSAADPWPQLPDEVLLQIFSHLSVEDLAAGVCGVCERWLLLVREELLQTELVFRGLRVSQEDMLGFLRAAPDLQSLDLRDMCWEKVFEAVPRYNPNLRRLSVRMFACTGLESALPSIIRNCQHLEDIAIKRTSFDGKLLQEMAAALPGIRKINFNKTDGFGRAELNAFVENCKELEEIRAIQQVQTMTNFQGSTCYVYKYHDEDILRLLQRFRQSLRVLKLGPVAMSERSAEALGRCSQLRVLRLCKAQRLSGAGLQKLTSLKKLESLRLSGVEVSSHDWCWFISQAPWLGQLRVLGLSQCPGVNDSVLAFVAAECPRLRKLVLSRCEDVSGRGLGKVLVGCRELRHLNVIRRGSPSSDYSGHRGVPRSFDLIPKYAPQLETLVVTNNFRRENMPALEALKAAMPNLEIRATGFCDSVLKIL